MDLDLDLDAELDKILSVGSPRKAEPSFPPQRPQPPESATPKPVAHFPALQQPAAHTVRPPEPGITTAVLSDKGSPVSGALGSSVYAREGRDGGGHGGRDTGELPGSRFPMPSIQVSRPMGRQERARAQADAGHQQGVRPRQQPHEPTSPGLGSVDALFDSLCADLGVEPESEGPPQRTLHVSRSGTSLPACSSHHALFDSLCADL